MQLTASTAHAIKNTTSNFAPEAQQGLKKAPRGAVSEAWLAFDTETKQEVQVEQPQSVKKPFLGPIETTLLAGLIVATLARHFIGNAHETK